MWLGVFRTTDWHWTGPQGDGYQAEVIRMALDVNQVIKEIRSRAVEAEIWNADGVGAPPDQSPLDLLQHRVQPHFREVLERLDMLAVVRQPAYVFSMASNALRSAFWEHPMPADFFGEEMQPLYRDAWFGMGHLVRACAGRLEGLPQQEKVTLASAAVCTMLDPTVDKVYGSARSDPKGALQLLDRVLNERDRGPRGRGR